MGSIPPNQAPPLCVVKAAKGAGVSTIALLDAYEFMNRNYFPKEDAGALRRFEVMVELLRLAGLDYNVSKKKTHTHTWEYLSLWSRILAPFSFDVRVKMVTILRAKWCIMLLIGCLRRNLVGLGKKWQGILA